jgi:hypothetical protein
LSSDQIDLAGGVNSRTGKPYRYRHGWILREGGQPVTGRMHMRGLENAEEKRAGVTKPPLRPASAKMKALGPARFRGAAEMDNAQAVRGRQHMRGLENTEIAKQHAASTASRTRTNKLVTRGFGDANARHSGNIGQVADKVTASLRGKKASDYQHLTAAKLHAAAAKYQSATPAERTHHLQLAAMHRGIASRTPGRGTRKPPQRQANMTVGDFLMGALGPGMFRSGKPATMKGPSPAPAKPGGYGRLPGGKAATKTAGRQQLLKAGRALPPAKPGGRPGFPIGNGQNWDDALKAVGRVGSPARREALRKLLIRTAPSVGRAGRIKGSWLQASNTGPALEFTMPTIQPVSSPGDIIVSRGEEGNVIIRHRNGGAEIGTMTRTEQGGWVATVAGKALTPRNHQRTALADIIGTHNKGALTERHKPASAGEPLQPAPRQTPLMQAYGIEAIRTLATPVAGASDGPRTTDNDADDTGSNGLGAKGKAIYKKLKARGFPEARAMAFAKRAENMGAGK